MVVFTVAEDIEAKIRRLRELGKASAEPETPPTPVSKPSPKPKPPRRIRRLSNIREREKKRRILIGASILIILILIVSFAAYSWYSSQKAKELKDAKQRKLAELNSYFKGDILKTSYGQATYRELKAKIEAAKSVEELNSIDIKSAYLQVYNKYKAELEEKKRQEELKRLNEAKEQKKTEIKLLFEPLLAQPLPSQIRAHALQIENELLARIDNATSIDVVNSTDPTPYLLQLWREYYTYKVDSIKGDYVVLEFNGHKKIYTKEQAKAILSGIQDYTVLMQYSVKEVQFVKIALLLTRDRVVGGFIEPGAKIMIFAQNATNRQYLQIADLGYVDSVLLPADAGIINLNEQQGSSSSSNTNSNSQSSSSSQNSASAGDTTVSTGGSSSSSSSSSESYSESSSASYYYSVNLGEIMRAISSGKIQGSEEAIKQLENYGDNLLALEKRLQLQNVPNGVPFLVIVEVPSVYVPDVLSHINTVYIGELVEKS